MQKLQYLRYFKVIYSLDALIITGVFLFYFLPNRTFEYARDVHEQNIFSIILLALIWILLSERTRLYSAAQNGNPNIWGTLST